MLLALNLAFAVVSGALCGTLVLLVSRRPVEPEAHWTERARAYAPARTTLAVTAVVIPVTLVVCVMMVLTRQLLETRVTVALASGLVAVGVMAAIFRHEERRVLPRKTTAGFFRDLALASLTAIWIFGVPVAMWVAGGRTVGLRWAVTVGVGALVLALWGRLDFIRMLAIFGLAVPAPKAVRAAVARAEARVGVNAASVWLLRSEVANAYAQPAHGSIVFTEPATALLDADETEALALHELGHVAEGLRGSRLIAFVVLTILGASRPLLHLGLIEGLVALILLLIPIAFVAQALRRRQEAAADSTAHEHVKDGPHYGRALEKLYEANLMPAVRGAKRPVYPDLYDRQLAAGDTPAYEKPLPPARGRALAIAGTILFLNVIATFVFMVWLNFAGFA